MNLNLKGIEAFVGGGSAGLGLGTAIELALLGASVTITGRTEATLAEALKLLDKSAGQVHKYLVLDFSDIKNLKTLITTFAASNKIQILVNNTGGPKPGRAIDKSPDEYTLAFESMVTAFVIQINLFTPLMKELGFGRIVNITSTSTKEPIADLGLSNVIRAAVANLGKSLASDLGEYGITVNNVLPGFHETQRIQSIISTKSKVESTSEDEIRRAMVAQIPARRFGTPEEFGAMVAFLCTPAAAYINGVNIPVDGGRLLGL